MNSGDDEQHDQQGPGRAFLGDTSSGSRPSHQRCTLKKKIILSLLIAGGILVVVILIVVTQTSSNKEETTDVDPHKRKCVYDVPGTDTKDPLKKKCNADCREDACFDPDKPICVYDVPGTDSKELLKKKCNPDSKYVKDKCRKDALHLDCQYCGKTRILLPKSCFCDEDVQCPNDKDKPGKKKCSTCLQEHFCPCLPHGNCTCEKNVSLPTADDLRCICKPGYGGFYCNNVPKRLCSYPNKTTGSLPDCYQSTADKCFIIDAVSNATLECVIFKEKNISSDLRKCVYTKEKIQE